MDTINARFLDGAASNRLESAGVLLHQFDLLDDPNPNGSPWLPGMGPRPDLRGHNLRLSASIVHARMQTDAGGNLPIFSFNTGGYILSPQHNQLACSYPFDIGSIGRQCWDGQAECVPGCTAGAGADDWCDSGLHRGNPDSSCAFRPTHLKKCMEAREELRRRGVKPSRKTWDDGKFYAELIFDAPAFKLHLPRSIEAVFYISPDSECFDQGCVRAKSCEDSTHHSECISWLVDPRSRHVIPR